MRKVFVIIFVVVGVLCFVEKKKGKWIDRLDIKAPDFVRRPKRLGIVRMLSRIGDTVNIGKCTPKDLVHLF